MTRYNNRRKQQGFKRREQEEEELCDLGDEVVLQHETEKAILVEIDGEEKWIPKSLIRPGSTVQEGTKGQKGCLVLPQWFVEKEKLV